MHIQDLNKNYDVIAGQFSASRQNLRWPLEDLFFIKLKSMKHPRILDLGCGSGRFFQYLKDHQADFIDGFDYVGLDSSVELIKQARATHPDGDWRVGAWQDLADLNLGKFNAIVSLASFHHIPRYQQEFGLKSVLEIMSEDSFLFLTVWNLWNIHRNKSWWLFVKDRLFLSKKKFRQKYKFEKKDLSTWQDTLMLWQRETPLFYYAFRRKELLKLAQKVGFVEATCQYENDSWRSGNNLYLIARK